MRYDDHKWVLKAFDKARTADHDNREKSRECQLFLDKGDGQWEQDWIDATEGRPRYTFDISGAIIDQQTGEIEKTNFTNRVQPMSGEATEDAAETFNGLIRAIHNVSKAERRYAAASEDCVKGGFGAIRVKTDYVDGDSFDQDLMIEGIRNAIDRVWFGPHFEQDASDAEYCWIATSMDPEAFKARYPDASETGSLDTDRQHDAFWHKNEQAVVGEFLYMQEERRELVRLSDGRIEDMEKIAPVLDELAAAGITVAESKPVVKKCCYSREFNMDGWLSEPRKTVFKHSLPVVPMYGRFAVVEDKVVYHGSVERIMDPQRVFNYSLSREIEEGAYAPREKLMMTEKQAQGHEDELETMNENPHPVQLYNADPSAPPPFKVGGAQVNPGLRNISESMRQIVGMSAGMFAASMGDNPGLQSGVAIEALQDRSDRGNNKYLESRIICQEQVTRILVDAIPDVYPPSRQVQIIGEDGKQEVVTIGQPQADTQTGALVYMQDLSAGKYSVRCEAAPSYETRQSETVTAITEVGKIDPTAVQMGSDIMFENIPSPGMDKIAERKRRQLLQMGVIPPDQMTDEEKAEMQKAQAAMQGQENPAMVMARAEEAKAQADFAKVQQEIKEADQKHQVEMMNLQLKEAEIGLKQVEVQIEAAKVGVDVKLKGAQTAKAIAEAEAQDIENAAVESGIRGLVEQAGG